MFFFPSPLEPIRIELRLMDQQIFDNQQNDSPRVLPRDARIINLILETLGVQQYSNQVPLQMLTFAHRYVYEVFQDAQVYADHSRGTTTNLTVDDVRLAVASKVNQSFKGPPPKEFLLELAAERNKRPLPAIRDIQGIRLPPEKYCLTQPNWDIILPENIKSNPTMENDKIMTDVKPEN